jgi:hypothetical protein
MLVRKGGFTVCASESVQQHEGEQTEVYTQQVLQAVVSSLVMMDQSQVNEYTPI